MDMTEKQLSSEYKFRGRIMTARVDEVSLPIVPFVPYLIAGYLCTFL